VNAKPRWDQSEAAMWRAMQALYEEDPSAFEIVLSDLVRAGDRWRERLPPVPKGRGTKPVQVTRKIHCLLLAEYRNALERNITREDFLAQLVQAGGSHDHQYFRGRWTTEEAVANHLKKAERIAKRDPDFKREVDTARRLIRLIAL
jgi:hypothetical protein